MSEKHWWLQPMNPNSLKELLESVQYAHERGMGLSCCTMNQIKIALRELQERMNNDNVVDRTEGV
jgi:hypothetical protein